MSTVYFFPNLYVMSKCGYLQPFLLGKSDGLLQEINIDWLFFYILIYLYTFFNVILYIFECICQNFDEEDLFFLMKLLSVAGQSVILMTRGSEAAAAMFTLFYIIPHKSTTCPFGAIQGRSIQEEVFKNIPRYFEQMHGEDLSAIFPHFWGSTIRLLQNLGQL